MRGAVLSLVAVLALGCDAGGHRVEGPRSAEGEGECGGCHADEVARWRTSMHHASYSSPDFQASLAEEPLAFCVRCHAPRAEELGLAEGGARGIDCATCHPGAEAHDRAAKATPAGARRSRPRTRSCDGCHELSSEGSATLLQSTVTEHAASAASAVPCASCHMKARGSTRDHGFAVSRDAEVLARAIGLLDARRTGERVTFSLAARGVGHAFPTGDLFRELRVRAWIETADGHVRGETEAALHRDWDAHRRAFGSPRAPDPLADTRLFDEPRAFVIAIPAEARDEPLVLRVTVDYRRGFEARAGILATFASTRVLDATRPLPSPGERSAP